MTYPVVQQAEPAYPVEIPFTYGIIKLDGYILDDLPLEIHTLPSLGTGKGVRGTGC